MTPERDEATEKSLGVLIAPATYAADTTPVAVDVRGFRSSTVLIPIGVGGITFDTTNKVEFVLTHSLDGGSTYNNVTDTDVILDPNFAITSVSNGILRSLIAAHASATCAKIGYIGGGSHLKLLADFSGTHGTGTPMSAVVVREDGDLIGAA